MHKFIQTAALGFLFILSGCIPSVHPLYTEQDLVFDSALVGEWSGKEGKETWTFTKGAERDYKVTYMDEKGKKGEFVVHLLKVAESRFLDFYPVDPDLKENDFYQIHLFPVHTFTRVQPIGSTLQMAMLNPDWLKKFLQENPAAVRHEKVDGSVLLTAQPKELQEFLMKHEKSADAWNECEPLTRRRKPTE